jgi:protocatechuate 3,4-dioxygenase beta subunit
MERKDFLRNGIAVLGIAGIVPLACKKDSSSLNDQTDTTGGTDTSGTTSGDCTVSPSETQGPFPTKSPSSLVRSDIKDDRTGVAFTIKFTILNTNNNCAALSGALVDIWHCDKDGNYSEYGGTNMQPVDYTSVNFLRGRQTTDSDGLVTFTSIFPGWYSGRAPHIHVHIYNAGGTSLLVTQVAFPEEVTNTVYTTATTFYTKGKQDTTNAADNVFSDSIDDELATVTGDITNGYVMTKNIYVAA